MDSEYARTFSGFRNSKVKDYFNVPDAVADSEQVAITNPQLTTVSSTCKEHKGSFRPQDSITKLRPQMGSETEVAVRNHPNVSDRKKASIK